MRVKNEAYHNKSPLRAIHEFLSRDQKLYFKKITNIYIKYHEAYKAKKTPLTIIKLSFYTILRNTMSPKRNVWLLGEFGDNLRICHGNVVIARGGKNG